jgi:hypothetical protein
MFLLLQWILPTPTAYTFGAVLMVNDKPQGLMYYYPCYGGNTSWFYGPIFERFDVNRDAIILAADGNVDNQ